MPSDVEKWLEENGLAKYGTVFADNHINMELLPHLTDADLKELGLSVGHRLTFLRSVIHIRGRATAQLKLPAIEAEQHLPDFVGERKIVTVLFCDIVESTRLARLIDAEELDNTLQAFFSNCAEIIDGFNGVLAAKKGDGALCWFGWPQAHADDPLRAVHAGLRLVRDITTIKIPSLPDWQLNVRVGIATGHVVVSKTVGHELPQIVGETPNLAERIKEAAPIATVVIDSDTRRLVGADFELVELGNRELKGFEGPIPICQVIETREGLTRFEKSHYGQIPNRLVGREGDIAMLKSRSELAFNGEGQIVLLSGQAGIGKSRLTAEFADYTFRNGCKSQLYQCSDLHQNTALYPIISRIMRDSGIRPSDAPHTKIKKLARLPPGELTADEQAIALFASLLGIPAHEGFVPPLLSPNEWRLSIFNLVLKALQNLCAQSPMLLIVEDMHWIDPTSLELLDAIITQSPSLPILVLVTSRGEELIERWSNTDNFTHLLLNRLSRSQSKRLCEDLIGNKQVDNFQLEQIVKAARGVPLFLEELAKHLPDATKSEIGKRYSAADPEFLSSMIPDHLFSFLAERLDKLDIRAGGKQVAQSAAVFGQDFSVALLAKIPSLQWIGDINAAVQLLLSAGLIVRSEGVEEGNFSFRHSIFREVAYSILLRSTRRAIHGEIATVLMESAISEPNVVAYHLTEANKPKDAIVYWIRAGQLANERSATVEAFSHFSNGLKLIEQLPVEHATHDLELSLRAGFGSAASAIEGYSARDIEENYARILELANAIDRPREKFLAHLGLGAFYEVGGDMEKCQLHCEECLHSAEQSRDPDELLHAHRLMGELNFYQGEFTSSCEHFKTALSLYNPKNHLRLIGPLGDDPAVLSLMYSALSLWFLGYSTQADDSCARGLQLAGELGHAFTCAQADFYASWLCAFQRDLIRARNFADAAIKRSTEQQFGLLLGLSQVIRGWATSRLNESGEGEEDILQGMALIRGPNADMCESAFLTFHADYHLFKGNVEKGLSLIKESEAVATERFATTDRLRLKAELLAYSDPKEARNLLQQAIETARQQKSLSMELRSALSLHHLPKNSGQDHTGIEVLRGIYSRFTEGFETSDVQEAGTILNVGHYSDRSVSRG